MAAASLQAAIADLNRAQHDAVTSEANVLQVLAPPGSGKTKTLTTRVAYLLSRGYKPWNIIVATFTIKAAKEMKERIEKLVGEGSSQKLVLGTFHSICRRYLVRYGQHIGLQTNFGIADTSDTTGILKRLIKKHGFKIEPGDARSRISGLKSRRERPAGGKLMEQQEFARLFTLYEAALAAANLLDYDDLLLECLRLLEKHPECAYNVEAVLVDEFQDTNVVQYELMKCLAAKSKRVTIVGDPDQSIYGFRAAERENLMKMRLHYLDCVTINLELNYRSTAAILAAADEVIKQDGSRPEKPLVATHGFGNKPVMRYLRTPDEEAKWMVSEIKRIKALTGGLFKYADFAMLVRSAYLTRALESALNSAQIPYDIVGGRRFYERVDVKLLLDYLRVVNCPDNTDGLLRVINTPARKIGDTTVKALLEESDAKSVTLWQLIKDGLQGRAKLSTKLAKQAESGLSCFMGIILSSQKKLRSLIESEETLDNLVRHLIKKLDYQEYIKKAHKDDWEDRWDNVSELVALTNVSLAATDDEDLPYIEGVEQASVQADGLGRFLAGVALTSGKEEQNGDKLTISTIHAAKGLEWPIVFIPAAYHGSIPHSRAEDDDEERRLLYVAMTRAKALLYMSKPNESSNGDTTTLCPFLSISGYDRFTSKQGPPLPRQEIEDLAVVVRRDCPPEQSIEQLVLGLDSLEDDVFPPYDEHGNLNGHRGGVQSLQQPSNGFEMASTRLNIFGSRQGSGFQRPVAAFGSSHLQTKRLVGETSGFSSFTSKRSAEPPAFSSTFKRPAQSSTGPNPKRFKPPTVVEVEVLEDTAPPAFARVTTFTNTRVFKAPEESTTAYPFLSDPIEQENKLPTEPAITEIKSQQAVAPLAPVRKTLGIRRSMNGWPPQRR